MVLLAGSLLLAACGDDDRNNETAQEEASPTRTREGDQGVVGSWVGKVADSDAFVGVTVFESRKVMAYVCDGQTVSQWFLTDDAGKDSFEASNANGAELDAKLSKEKATGTVTLPGGQELTFDAPRAALDGGLYRGKATIDGADYVGGWIVLPNGEQRGAIQGGGATIKGGTLNTATPAVSVAGGTLQARLVTPFVSKIIEF
ncbi:MAG: hypothetical protein ACRDJE_20425 [Dehalococcoidia bacterium]